MIKKYPSIIDEVYKDNENAKRVLLIHSFCVANEALQINKDAKLNLNEEYVYEASMLHDIGIIGTNANNIFCFGDRPYIEHGIIGAKFLENTPFEKYKGICLRHFGVGLNKEEVMRFKLGNEAMEPETIEEKLIAYADNFYSKATIKELECRKTEMQIINNLKRFGIEKVEKFYELKDLFSQR